MLEASTPSTMILQPLLSPQAASFAPAEAIIGARTPEDFISNPIRYPGVFNPAECRAIVELGEAGTAVIAGLSRPVEGYRTGVTKLIGLNSRTEWLYARLGEILVAVNDWYQFDIRGFVDSLLYCTYPEQGQFDWHVDCGEGATSTRKITLSLQLSDGTEYEGGALEFAGQGELAEARRIGTAVAFPAFVHHRVTTVKRGVRRSLVAWAHGPAFR